MKRPVQKKRPQPKAAQRKPAPVAPEDQDRHVSAAEAMRIVGVSNTTWFRWRQEGVPGFPDAIRYPGRRAVRYRLAAVIAFARGEVA